MFDWVVNVWDFVLHPPLWFVVLGCIGWISVAYILFFSKERK